MKRTNRLTYIYIVILSILFIMLFCRCKYGIGNIDESFYLTIPYRMTQGDTLFLHEWFPTQMSALLTYPFMKLFISITGSTNGIILSFRYIYLIINLIATIALYFIYKKYSQVGAYIGSLLFFCFAPYGIPALSYNSMGVIFLTLSLSLFACKDNSFLLFVSGMFFSFAVLCCPFLVILFIIYFICVLINTMFKNAKYFSLRRFIFFTLGILSIFSVFCLYIIRNMSLSQFLSVVPNTFSVSNSHHFNIYIKLKELADIISGSSIQTIILLVFYFLITLFGSITKNENTKCVSFILIIILSIVNIFNIAIEYDFINYFMITPIFISISTYCIYRNKKIRNMFYFVCIPTLIYCLCIHFTSNQGLRSISVAAATLVCTTIVMLFVTLNDISAREIQRSAVNVLIFLFSITQFSVQLHYRMNRVFWEDNINNQTILIENGINKGLCISQERYLDWNDLEYDVSSNVKNSKVLFATDRTWLYLINNYENCSYSAWYEGAEPLIKYYKINPDKLPEIVFVGKNYSKDISGFLIKYNYKYVKTTSFGNLIYIK